MTVEPLTVLMQVFRHIEDCVLQADRQVADVLLGVTGETLGVVAGSSANRRRPKAVRRVFVPGSSISHCCNAT